jgi:hypothetical protein
MALKINNGPGGSAVDDILFGKVLTDTEHLNLLTEVRHNIKPKFSIGFYTVTAVYDTPKGQCTTAVTLDVSTTALIKEQASNTALEVARGKIANMLHLIKDTFLGTESAPEPTTVIFKAKPAVKPSAKAPAVESGKFMAVPPLTALDPATGKPPVKYTGNPVPLKNALLLGQPVLGTSPSSVYYTVAMSQRIKMAIRLSGGTMSVRVEGKPTEAEVKTLAAAGLSGHSSKHYSMHLNVDDVPPARVLGALLLGIGIEFDDQLTTMKGMPVHE